MSDQTVTIEIDGQSLTAEPGSMIMQVADEAGIYIPRFCYHKHLSIAANCRMCLVEVEKAPKPLPACATPVRDGMKVYTQSPLALDAQKGTMEFLLINHPLDCPICDQGGECELQDVSMGFGADISRYTESKRVVRDKDIGPLIETEMTRCIHCTRCVRFGQEIAGIPELGATGRGEDMEIGTYVERALESELSGNVIDLCPVGALTAKPSRYQHRSWELLQHPVISPHDSLGSNVYVHTRSDRVIRAVPKENEAINQTWIADRDRYSYEGLYHDDRVTQPEIKDKQGRWHPVDWSDAFEAVTERLRRTLATHGPKGLGALASPNASLEELYLLQKIVRGLGSHNVDHRLREMVTTDQAELPTMPWLGVALPEVESIPNILYVGGDPRKDAPLLNHRLRRAALAGSEVGILSNWHHEPNYPHYGASVAPNQLAGTLAAFAQQLLETQGRDVATDIAHAAENSELPPALRTFIESIGATDPAADSTAAPRGWVVLGPEVAAHPDAAALRSLAGALAQGLGWRLGVLPFGANGAGAWLAGAIPHRQAGGKPVVDAGLSAAEMLAEPRSTYLLLGCEPELDAWDSAQAQASLAASDTVIAMTSYASETLRAHADVLLPIGSFVETAGTYCNAEGLWQNMRGTARPLGEARPGWKVLRVLGNYLQLPGFEYVSADEVRNELKSTCRSIQLDNTMPQPSGSSTASTPRANESVQRIGITPIYGVDSIVRRAPALQQTPDAERARAARMNPATIETQGLARSHHIDIGQGEHRIRLPLVSDERVPPGCVVIAAGIHETQGLGPRYGAVEVSAIEPVETH